MSIQSILNQVDRDEIVLPAIQRSFVWDSDKIIRLLDSVMRKYPIGIVLLWETYNEIQHRTFTRSYRRGDIYNFAENLKEKRLKLVLDGQQRLQSLYIALHGNHEGKYLYFDMLSGKDSENVADERYKFEFLGPEEAKRKNLNAKERFFKNKEKRDARTELCHFIKVTDLFSMPAEEKLALKESLGKEFELAKEDLVRLDVNISKFYEVFSQDENILKVSTIDEDLPIKSPARKSEADVLEIFVRINREGTPLNRSDLIFSMIKLRWKESAVDMPEFVKSIREKNSFELDTDFVIRCLFAVSDLGAKFDIDLLRNKKNVDLLKTNFTKCCNAIRSTIDFVQQNCQCQSEKLIGGQFTLVPFVYYLFHTKNHDVRNDQLDRVRKAFFLFAFAKPFSRYVDSRLGVFIRQLLKPLAKQEDEMFPLEKSIDYVKYWEGIDTLEKLFDKNDMLSLHLIQGLTGAKVQYEDHAPEIDHIFPRSVLRKKEFSEELINHFANFWILAKNKNRNKLCQHPAQYFKEVDEKTMKEALIDRDMLDYRCYTTFLEKRKQLMINKLKEKIGFSDSDLIEKENATEKEAG